MTTAMPAACLFVSDLHGHLDKYEKLFTRIARELPKAVFVAGDLLPSGLSQFGNGPSYESFLENVLAPRLTVLKQQMGSTFPRIFVIMGNDDLRSQENSLQTLHDSGLCEYIHNCKSQLGSHPVYGYAYSPPSQFLLKDWERYDISRYTDPGCVSTEEGWRTTEVPPQETRYATMLEDLQRLTGSDDLAEAVMLFHAPPYDTLLDRAALDGKRIDHVPLDVHVGSIAIRRLIDARQPLLTLHGHIHESARITGSWQQQIGRTWAFNAAHDGPELALVRFDLGCLSAATRELV